MKRRKLIIIFLFIFLIIISAFFICLKYRKNVIENKKIIIKVNEKYKKERDILKGNDSTIEILNNINSIKNKKIISKDINAIESKSLEEEDNNGIIYLTFDDGPDDKYTSIILDILKEEKIKATFFVTMKGSDSILKREFDEGHSIGLHTAYHQYNYLYSSVDNYFKDLNIISDRVEKITGEESKIIRFPGGSSNTVSKQYSKGIMTQLTKEVINRGYHYFDWNVSGEDAGLSKSSTDVYNNVVNNLKLNKENMVLLHDTNPNTAGALKNIIKYAKEKGYRFKKITYNTEMIKHGIKN